MCRAAARGWRRGVLAAAVGIMASQCGILALQKYCWCRATAHGWRMWSGRSARQCRHGSNAACRVQACSGPLVSWKSPCDLGSGCPSGTWQSTLRSSRPRWAHNLLE
ncbi:hypothetical protein PR002_g16738 [Phytophthora rubi]|uniref:Uncharacterized protein n=1 Tax=Phytophthora rubi TaxID=129364 RepID=A0A6A3KKH6_9STRA|nr:hypothetical protein PR002_g16738 [Phytophthora rubi]